MFTVRCCLKVFCMQDGMISIISFQSHNFPEISLPHVIISKETRYKNQVLLKMNNMKHWTFTQIIYNYSVHSYFSSYIYGVLIIAVMTPVSMIKINIVCLSPGQVAQLVGASSHAPKGGGFDLWSGHIGEAIDGCLSLISLSMFLSLSPFLSLNWIDTSLGEDLKKKNSLLDHVEVSARPI